MDLVRAWYYQEETDPAVADAFIAAYEKLQSWCEKGYFGDIETVLGVDHPGLYLEPVRKRQLRDVL